MTLLKLATYFLLLIYPLRKVSANEPTSASNFVIAASQANTAEFIQKSPIWLSSVKGPKNSNQVVKSFPLDSDIKAGPLSVNQNILNVNLYPEVNKQPSPNHPEIEDVIKQLDFTKIPNIEPRKVKDWVVDIKGYDLSKDPDCWWSSSLCKKPKLSYLPDDIYVCPQKGDWGLNYDDGPYRLPWPRSEQDKIYDQPRFYNFLVKNRKQKATLFFVGSNVIKFPEAAQRALNDGHTICIHTWSHPQMTTLTNQEIVAQLYWTQKAIKETLGITPKCWRPPYGDVDDRVRAIAWQMGMRTFLWDQDSNDWSLANNNDISHLKTEAIDRYFDQWIQDRIAGNDTDHGHVTLQHENSKATILMSEKWLPKIQAHFRVMPIHQCINDPHPYWEEFWIYPTLDNPNPSNSKGLATGNSISSEDISNYVDGKQLSNSAANIEYYISDRHYTIFALKTLFLMAIITLHLYI
ncbi:uncharacterized protein BX663DRAFT_432658 [Cokeromyces recurvatus]|uniref:uncharacterized protein n=1 Tax=Cokeromyces recurvatus TaxID=90255 RepID=UPI00221F9D61|nr:uncharacterized protein BX663DRAFT_432658 [Cokeromyces recurvatus]KAI7903776.1 hypothetical protein BX663DRAFT_432658 [Cokeromyces recurvatus]